MSCCGSKQQNHSGVEKNRTGVGEWAGLRAMRQGWGAGRDIQTGGRRSEEFGEGANKVVSKLFGMTRADLCQQTF